MRGITETVRGKGKDWPEQRCQIGMRNASETELATARKAIGRTVHIRDAGEQSPPYRIADVRLDSLKRLIVDLVLDSSGSEANHVHDHH